MKRISATLAFPLMAGLALLAGASSATAAQGVNRCEVDGRVTYSDLPCAPPPDAQRDPRSRADTAAPRIHSGQHAAAGTNDEARVPEGAPGQPGR